MKNILLCFLLIIGLSPGCRTAKLSLPAAEAGFTIVFEPAPPYASMRIPALVLTKQGTLLAFCEGRIGTASDWTEMDMLMRRSTDGGRTWEPAMVIAARQDSMPTSNATPIVDANGTVHLLYQRGYEKAFYTKSNDDGKTWSRAVEITYAFDDFRPEYNWQVLAPGPGHSIQMKNGRLLAPVWICNAEEQRPHKRHYPSRVATIYSDDTGRTWKRGAIIPDAPAIKNPSEAMVVELADGSVMLNMRHSGGAHRRGISYSPDGIGNWTVPVIDTALFEPVCMASIIRVNDKAGNGLVFVNPDSRDIPKFPRKNLMAKFSTDEGKTWPLRQVIDTAAAGYSDLAVDKNGTVYCLYETNTIGKGWNYSLVLKRFRIGRKE